MTISAALQTRYSTEVDVDWWEALVLSHSKFSQTYYLCSDFDDQRGYIDGAVRTFDRVPFEFTWPDRSDTGRGDMQVVIGAIDTNIVAEIESALTDPTERIKARFTVFILGNTTPQYEPPIELSLTNIVVTEAAVSGVATNVDTLNAPFPSGVYRTDTFPGLARR